MTNTPTSDEVASFANCEFAIGKWAYFTEDHHDEDLKRDLSHFAVHEDTGQVVDIAFQRGFYMTRMDFARLILMGFPVNDSGSWTQSTIRAAFDQHVLLRAAGMSWDIEVAS